MSYKMKQALHISLIFFVFAFIGCGKVKEAETVKEVIPVKGLRIEFRDLDETIDYVGNIKAQESKAAEFGNRRGYRVLFTTEKPDKMNILTTWTIKGGRAYILMYMAAGKKYETYRPYVEDMIKSFELR